MSFKHYLPSLCSPVVAVADLSENVVDEAWMPVFFVAAPGLFLRLPDSENSLHGGGPPGGGASLERKNFIWGQRGAF